MTPRERQLATIRHEITDRISIDAICIENQDKIAEQLGIDVGDVYDRLGIDGRVVAARYAGPEPACRNGEIVDSWGVPVDPGSDDYGTSHWYPLQAATSVAEVERHACPSPDDFSYTDSAAAIRPLAERYALRGPYWSPIFCQVCNLFGMEEAMVRMAAEPAIFEAAVAKVSDFTFEYCRRMVDAFGDDLPIFCLGDDFATQRGLMISPEHWRRYLKPHYAKLFGMAKSRGKFVWFHSCGDITSVLPDLIDCGMDVWETVQLHTLPMSAEALKREYGKYITFFGGVNTQNLPFTTPGKVREEVCRCIEVLGRDGGYICGPDHHIKPDVSVENTLALFDTARELPGATGGG